MHPFLKWAGGKRWLVQSGALIAPPRYNRFIEPFLGGAAVFFSLEPASAVLSDINPELIDLYEVVRDHPIRLRSLLVWHQARHSKAHYYSIRNRVYKNKIWRAARTLYLNRTCWNGLYRLNRNGEFNVPIGTKVNVLTEDSFLEASVLLKNSVLLCQDFEITIDGATGDDFLFVDPPYTVKHNLNGFLKYNEKIFSWDDQIRLKASLVRAARRGAAIIVTNADHQSLRDLYCSDFTYQPVQRHSVLSGNSAGRGKTSEAMFTANLDHAKPHTPARSAWESVGMPVEGA